LLLIILAFLHVASVEAEVNGTSLNIRKVIVSAGSFKLESRDLISQLRDKVRRQILPKLSDKNVSLAFLRLKEDLQLVSFVI